MRLLVVAAAALVRKPSDAPPQVLLAQRPTGDLAGLWEFPGGKLEPGEPPEAALVRELMEELGVEQPALEPLSFASHALSPDVHLLMPLFLVTAWSGTPSGREGQQLAWVTREELAAYAMPPADVPLVPHVERVLASL